MKKLTIILALMFLIVVPMVSSFGPNTHLYIANQIKIQGQDLEIVQMCLNGGINEQSFKAGSVISDITVTKYFSDGGRDYKFTHNHNFQQELLNLATTDDEKCFCYGIMGGHLVPDAVSHTMAVPGKIKSRKLTNWILHPH